MTAYHPGTPEQRAALKRYHRELNRARELRMQLRQRVIPTHTRSGKLRFVIIEPDPPPFPEYPEECHYMACGAKTRKGTPCKLTAIYINGRCRFHGGLSTGPRTPEGKARAALNGLRPKRKKRTP